MPDPTRSHLNNLTIPVGGTLCQQERNYFMDKYGVGCAVRYRKAWRRRAMSMNGKEKNFEETKIRIDVHMQNGFSHFS